MRTGTFTKIYIQVVFAVNGRASLISERWEENLYKYITGIVTNQGQKMLAINGAYDHIHFLIGMKPTCCLSDLVRDIKKATNEWVNANDLTKSHFSWQEGYGGFSYSYSDLDNVITYIHSQKEHHKRISFKKEYTQMLKDFEIDFKDEYLFEWIADDDKDEK